MKIKWSPLVASASGTTADAVAASWKGIQYVRKHVIPHNPKSAAQTLVREALARCVTLWRSLHTDVKAWLDTYGVDYRLSGFNVFMSKSRTLEQAGSPIFPVPASPHVDAVLDGAAATGAVAAGDIDVTWTAADPTALTHVAAIARETLTNRFCAMVTALDAAETLTIEGLTPDTAHDVYFFYHNPTTKQCGTPTGDQAIDSKAA